MQALVVPKNRKPKFDLSLKIVDFNNVPYNAGRVFVKWHIAHSAGEHRGSTEKEQLKDHFVTWKYETQIPVRLVVDRNGMLQESHIEFDVYHESDGLKSKLDRAHLGNRKLNMAEYVEASERAGADGICQRYLLHSSKINSTLKICMNMQLVEGDRNFIAPPLKDQQVFGGIAGIMTGPQRTAEDKDDTPVLSTKVQEAGEDLRNLYRRTLAADWTCRPGEPSADRCIEDIFAGGDGWGDLDGSDRLSGSRRLDDSGELSDSTRTLRNHKPRNWQGFFSKRGHEKKRSVHDTSDKESLDGSAIFHDAHHTLRGQASFEHQAGQMKAYQNRRNKITNEVDELQCRDNMRCWQLDHYK